MERQLFKPDTLYFNKVREVKLPTRGTSLAAGIDFYLPHFNNEFWTLLKEKNPHLNYGMDFGVGHNDAAIPHLWLKPGKRINIPSGIRVHFGEYNQSALIAANKSGLSTKKGIQFTAQVVDSDYQGEIHIGIINLSQDIVYFQEDDKMIQFIHTPVLMTDIEEVDDTMLSRMWDSANSSQRGIGGFGSTGR